MAPHEFPSQLAERAARTKAVARRTSAADALDRLSERARHPTRCDAVAGARLNTEAKRVRMSVAHDKGAGMIEPALRDRLTTVYATWLDDDDLGQRYVEVCSPRQDAGVTSVRQFLEELLRLSSGPNPDIERPGALEHPDSTFMQLLGSPLVRHAGPRALIESLAHHTLCLQPIPRLMFEACGSQDQIGSGIQPHAVPPRERTGLDPQDFSRGINDSADHAELADTLMAVLKSRLGPRTIRSFFTVDVGSNG